MRLVACIDDGYGIAFGQRRQSRDRALTRDLVALVGEGRILAREYSRALFDEAGFGNDERVVLCEDPSASAKPHDTVLLEVKITDGDILAAEELVLYFWNRKYPSTAKLSRELISSHFVEVERTEFVGNSHEKLTRCTYKRKF